MYRDGCIFALENTYINTHIASKVKLICNKLRNNYACNVYVCNKLEDKYICVCGYKHVKNKGQAFET